MSIKSLQRVLIMLLLIPLIACAANNQQPANSTAKNASAPAKSKTYTQKEILNKAEGFFGETSKGLAKALQKVFEDHGEPNAYITGEEAAGAIGIGLRYGKGYLNHADGTAKEVFWQGPSVGFDLGGNAAKVFTLVYNLRTADGIYQRFPGVEGTLYFIAGFGVNYMQSDGTIVAPIRTGVGWRQGANIGYLHYTRKSSWNPF